ncbi:hypothetical protein Q3G72_024547 [Acer saccharum]|nr:hypothetical protein Q3G72_024547 [Acer saccharum]
MMMPIGDMLPMEVSKAFSNSSGISTPWTNETTYSNIALHVGHCLIGGWDIGHIMSVASTLQKKLKDIIGVKASGVKKELFHVDLFIGSSDMHFFSSAKPMQ